jgi:hypothetical protein
MKGIALLTAVAIALAADAAVFSRVKVRVEYDKTFSFKPMRTWAWNPQGHGDVITARTADDNREVARQRAEPIIVDAVTTEMPKCGLQPAMGEPDLLVRYFLLLTLSTDAQTVGQFLPATADWGLPLFPPATQSLTVKNKGTLVLDLSTKDKIVWRGVADAQLDLAVDDKKRESVLREAVRDLLRKYPGR